MNPLSLIPAPYAAIARAVAVALVIAAIYATGRSHGAASVQADWGASTIKQQAAALAADQAARDTEKTWSGKVIEAQNEAKQREQKLAGERDAARRVSDRLRDDLAALRRGLPGNTADACRITADAALAVFGECAAEAGRLAEAADGHASDAGTFADAWPR